MKNIISLDELSPRETAQTVQLAIDIRENPDRYRDKLRGKSLLLLFQKTSTRTRVAFELGMKKLGGSCVVLDWNSSNFAISPIEYEAGFVNRTFDCIMARLVRSEDLRILEKSVDIPLINGCDDLYHPSQALADLMTVYEAGGGYDSTLCYVGVQNNVANSLFYGCEKTGVKLIFVTPLRDSIPDDLNARMEHSAVLERCDDLEEAADRCGFIYTDTWINMEHFHDKEYEEEKRKRTEIMHPYQINRSLIEGRDLYVMHDMPLHPGYEIDEYAIGCEKSLIFKQAENRLYTAQALLLSLLG